MDNEYNAPGEGTAAPTLSSDGEIRLPMHRGLFYFGPKYLASVEEWQAHFNELLRQIFDSSEFYISFPFEKLRLAEVKNDKIRFVIDADSGMFTLDEAYDSDDDLDEFSIFGTPQQFTEWLKPVEAPQRISSDVASVAEAAAKIFAIMKRRFETAIQNGYATVSGRIDDPFGPLAKIDFHQFALLTLTPRTDEISNKSEDLRLDDARAPEGRTVYSVGVTESAKLGVRQDANTLPLLPIKKAKRGRVQEYDRDAILKEGHELFAYYGALSEDDPDWKFRSHLEKKLGDFCEKKYGKRPAKSTLQPLAERVLKEEQPELAGKSEIDKSV